MSVRIHVFPRSQSCRAHVQVGIQLESQRRLERLREVRLRNEARLKGLNPDGSKKPEGAPESPAKLLSTPKAVDRRVCASLCWVQAPGKGAL